MTKMQQAKAKSQELRESICRLNGEISGLVECLETIRMELEQHPLCQIARMARWAIQSGNRFVSTGTRRLRRLEDGITSILEGEPCERQER